MRKALAVLATVTAVDVTSVSALRASVSRTLRLLRRAVLSAPLLAPLVAGKSKSPEHHLRAF